MHWGCLVNCYEWHTTLAPPSGIKAHPWPRLYHNHVSRNIATDMKYLLYWLFSVFFPCVFSYLCNFIAKLVQSNRLLSNRRKETSRLESRLVKFLIQFIDDLVKKKKTMGIRVVHLFVFVVEGKLVFVHPFLFERWFHFINSVSLNPCLCFSHRCFESSCWCLIRDMK